MRSKGETKTTNALLADAMTRQSHRSAIWAWGLSLVALAAAVKSGWLIGFDRGIMRAVGAHHGSVLDVIVRVVTFFGSTPCALIVVILTGGWWWRTGARATLRTFTVAGAAGLLIEIALRISVSQWRPDVQMLPVPLTLITRAQLAGFPSGHAFRAAFLYGWWVDELRKRRTRLAAVLGMGCIALIFLVGLTRVYLQRHWFTDVVGGWVLAETMLAFVAPPQRRA